ncbi:MAG: helix-turn-helix domain-containing protein [Rhodothermales bacterium]
MNHLKLADHLAPSAIFERYRQAIQAVQRTQWQVIYLKSQGKMTGEIAEVTGYSAAWIRRLIHRYNRLGPAAFARLRTSTPGVVPLEAVKQLEADYARKSEELDMARQVQLSMLRPPVPDHPDLAIAVFMETAS